MSIPIHIAPDSGFDDWVVQDDNGRNLGHFPTRESAELAARAFAQKRGDQLVIHLPDGRTDRQTLKKGWFARFLGR